MKKNEYKVSEFKIRDTLTKEQYEKLIHLTEKIKNKSMGKQNRRENKKIHRNAD